MSTLSASIFNVKLTQLMIRAEHVTAVTVSVKDKLTLSLGVAVGSSIVSTPGCYFLHDTHSAFCSKLPSSSFREYRLRAHLLPELTQYSIASS